MQHQDHAAAVALLEKAVAEKPDDEESVVGLASAYINIREREKALALLRDSLEKMPQSTAVLALLLTIAMQDNELESAEDYLQQLLAMRPEDPVLFLQLSDMRLLAGQEEESRSVLVGYLQKHPAEDLVRVRLADFDAEQDQFDRALDVLDGAPEQTGLIRLARASVLGRAGRTAEAETLLRALTTDPSTKDQTAEARFGLVEIYLENMRIEDAEKELSLLLVDEPQNMDALFLRGRIYFSMGRFSDAANDFTRLVDADENDLEAILALADAYNASGVVDQAEALITSVIQRAPQFGPAYTTLANLHMMWQRPEAALMTLSIGRQEVPEDPSLPALEAEILASIGRFDEAVAILETFAGQEEFREGALMRLGAVYGAAGDHQKAADAYASVLAANPDFIIAAEGHIRALIAGNKEKEALAFAEKRQLERPEDPTAAYLTGEAALATGDNAKAEAAFLRALELAPGWESPLTILAQYYSATNRMDKALELARKSKAAAPEALAPPLLLAMLLEDANDLDAAEKIYRDILANDPESLVAANNLAFLITRHKADPERLREAEELALLASATGIPATLDTLGWVRFLRGNDEGAEELLRLAHESTPENPTFAFHLASVLVAMSKQEGRADAAAKKEEARTLLQGAVAGGVDFSQRADAKKLLDELK
jgi:tetratricopeptide (TPR) repeat protein